jgi:DNA-binding response OmpR family regulator
MPKEKILVVDDEERIVAIVKAYLERDGYRVVTAFDGRQALELTGREHPDLVILDLMLPELSGWEVLRSLRSTSAVPVLMLTARDEDAEKIVGLEMGADDYVTKPFNPRELLARVRAILRRTAGFARGRTAITTGSLVVDPERHEARRDGVPVPLTPTEFALLEVLARHPGRAFTRLQLLDLVQGESYEGFERALDSHIKNLRQKIEPEPRHPKYILTVFGVGYKFAERPDA